MMHINESIRNTNRVFDENERTNYLRLDLNENPDGLPFDFIKKVLSKISKEDISKSPETKSVTEKIAKYNNVSNDCVCITNGSAEAIRYVFECFTSVCGKVVSIKPAYFMYNIYSQLYGRNIVEIDYDQDFNISVDSIKKNITEDTQLLILMNPNNPIGDKYRDKDIEDLLDTASSVGCVVLIDEAYCDFCGGSASKLLEKYNNIIIVKTFSKFFSMAGLRFGYAVGSSDLISTMRKACTPHNTNVFAHKFAEEILSDEYIIDELKENFVKGKSNLINFLDANNYKYINTYGNFILIRVNGSASKIVNNLKKNYKILIKKYDFDFDTDKYIRVTIGGESSMRQFIDALSKEDL